jgi:predicted GIY-YIG superfamily endonuclease
MAVYRPYDAAGSLLYVGVTKNFGQRWQRHAAEKPWWSQMARMTVDWYDDEAAAVRAEQDAISNERPVHNIARTNKNYRSSRTLPGMPPQKYVGSAEIGRMLGVGRQRVQQIVCGADFPWPYDVLAMGKVWKRADVIEWARARGRPVENDDS